VGASAEQQIEGLAMRAEAVALFNREELEASMTLKLSDVRLEKAAYLRDVWADKDISVENGIYTAVVPKHGVVLLRIRKQ
jgi:alpha-galactosidase